MEAVDKTLAHVFVNHRVMSDVKIPFLGLLSCWKFTVEQQVCDLEEG